MFTVEPSSKSPEAQVSIIFMPSTFIRVPCFESGMTRLARPSLKLSPLYARGVFLCPPTKPPGRVHTKGDDQIRVAMTCSRSTSNPQGSCVPFAWERRSLNYPPVPRQIPEGQVPLTVKDPLVWPHVIHTTVQEMVRLTRRRGQRGEGGSKKVRVLMP